MNIGDKVPKEDYEYYVVEKPFVKPKNKKDCDDCDYSDYEIGQRIIAEKRYMTRDVGGYAPSFKEFLNNNCRRATLEEETQMYDERFCNALVLQIYDDNSYQIGFYYVPIKDLGLLEYTQEKDYWKKRKIKDNIFKSIGIDYIPLYEIDDDGQFIYVEGHEANEELLKCCRKAIGEEAEKLNAIVAERKRIAREAYLARKRAEEQEKLDRYNKHKSDSNYYPGSCGNYNQVLVNSDGKPEKEKLYDLYTIRQFYDELINSGNFDKELLKKLILYGGTVPYMLLGTKEEVRKFGDVDIFIPVENMNMFRQALLDKSYFEMTFDSMELTKKANLTVAGTKFKMPWYMGDFDDMDAYRSWERSVAIAREEAKNSVIYQDYGFKGSLFGVHISVFPLYQWQQDMSMDVCAKSFRVGKEEGDSKFLLNTVVTHNTPIKSFSRLVELCGGTIGVANLEYTIASKKSAINHGYILRQESDNIDLEFMNENRRTLDIDEDLVTHYEENIPDYGIAKVYRIKRNFDVSEIEPEKYKDLVTRNVKPS